MLVTGNCLLDKLLKIKKKAKCAIDRVAISCLFLRFMLIFKSNVLQNMNALISKKCAYFRFPCLFFRV